MYIELKITMFHLKCKGDTIMLKIVKGYKQGRAVMFYDLADEFGKVTHERLDKDSVVKMCESGEVCNAKIQWWEGKPIVRCADKNLPLVKLGENNEVMGAVAHRSRNNIGSTVNETVVHEKAIVESTVVGKLADKKPKKQISFDGYAIGNVVEQRAKASELFTLNFNTIEDMFVYIANDFGIKNVDLYKKEISKKIKLERLASSVSPMQLRMMQYSIATYLMNMKYNEIADAYTKYAC